MSRVVSDWEQPDDVGEPSFTLKACFTPYCSDSAHFEVPEDLSVMGTRCKCGTKSICTSFPSMREGRLEGAGSQVDLSPVHWSHGQTLSLPETNVLTALLGQMQACIGHPSQWKSLVYCK